MKDTLIIIVIICFSALLYGLTLRGAPGVPTVSDIKGFLDQPTQALELSPERGRYLQIMSLAQTGKYNLSPSLAAAAYPDVGVSPQGKMSSYFAPGVSYMALPLYLIGERFDMAQVAAFSIEPIVSIITLVFIYLIGVRLFRLPRWAALFAVLIFGFGSTSWSYAITLYQNAFTACFSVTAFYAVYRFKEATGLKALLYAGWVWLAFALSITVDYPNALMMLPIMVYLAYLTFPTRKVAEGFVVGVRFGAIASFAVFILVTGAQFWHNTTYYGGWDKTAGGLADYTPPGMQAGPELATSTLASTPQTLPQKSIIAFFSEHNIPHSLYILLFSDQRGLFFYSPIFILSILGIWYALRYQRERFEVFVVPLGLMAVNLLLYSSWGDPWGGWAFGPRYLIPSMPWLALFVAMFLSTRRGIYASLAARSVALVLFFYSCAISLVGALTTNAIPTRGEAMQLPIKEYNFLLNFRYLADGRSSSFAYKEFFSSVPLDIFYLCIFAAVAFLAFTVVSFSRIDHA